MTDPIARIRALYNSVINPEHTVCKRVNVTLEEFKAGKHRDVGACCWNMVNDRVEIVLRSACNEGPPLMDEDWVEDVGILLSRFDNVEGLLDDATCFLINNAVVELVECDRGLTPKWRVSHMSCDDAWFDKRCDAIDFARGMPPIKPSQRDDSTKS